MKTYLQKLFLLAIIFLTPNFVHAESSCSYNEQAELNDIVANVKANYEVVNIYNGKFLDIDNQDENGNIPEVDSYIKGFDISILNLTEDIYVKISNDKNSESMTYYYKDTNNGMITFRTTEIEKLVNYTIEVYSNKYSCVGELYRSIPLSTPIYNPYSEMIACQDNPEFYYCQEFIPSENISLNEFAEKIQKYEQETKPEEKEVNEKENFFERIKRFYTYNKTLIYSIGIVIVVGVATTVILVKKKRSRVL